MAFSDIPGLLCQLNTKSMTSACPLGPCHLEGMRHPTVQHAFIFLMFSGFHKLYFVKKFPVVALVLYIQSFYTVI